MQHLNLLPLTLLDFIVLSFFNLFLVFFALFFFFWGGEGLVS